MTEMDERNWGSSNFGTVGWTPNMKDVPEAVREAVQLGGPTPLLADFRKVYDQDDNWWWAIDCGHHMNLFDAAIEQLDEARACALEQSGPEPADRLAIGQRVCIRLEGRFSPLSAPQRTGRVTAIHEYKSGEIIYDVDWPGGGWIPMFRAELDVMDDEDQGE